MTVEYDVALSFAGSERDYVRRVEKRLTAEGIKVFVDEVEDVNLWGKDLSQHLDEVYRRKARYCVVFVSRDYADRAWPSHELKSALARAVTEREEYILPARFDDTELPGLRNTVGYMDLRGISPEKLAEKIMNKLGRSFSRPAQSERPFRVPQLKGKMFNPYQEGLDFIATLKEELPRRCDSLGSVSCSIFDSGGRTCLRFVYDGKTAYSLDVWMGGISGGSSLGFLGQPGESRWQQNSSNAWGEFIDSPTGSLIRFNDLSLLGRLGEERPMSAEDLIDAIWNKICDALENAQR